MSSVSSTIRDFFQGYDSKRYAKGTILLRPEEPLLDIFYLESGTVAQYDISSSGNEVIVNVFKTGAFFPMSYALTNTANQYYFFEVTTQSHIRTAPAAAVVTFLEEDPAVTLDLLKRVYRGSDGLLRRTAHLMGGSAKSRLIFELLNAGHRFGDRLQTTEITIPLTESDIAKRSGLSRETVNRTMKSLKAAELVRVTPRGIIICSITQLQKLLGSDL